MLLSLPNDFAKYWLQRTRNLFLNLGSLMLTSVAAPLPWNPCATVLQHHAGTDPTPLDWELEVSARWHLRGEAFGLGCRREAPSDTLSQTADAQVMA